MKVEESLNVTFDESPPPTKLSPLVDDDVGEEEAIKNNTKVVNNNNEEDESIEVDEVVNIKESKNHPLDQVIGNLNQRTLRSQAQNHSNFFCFISTIEPKNVNEALKDESWVVAMQEELNQFVANDVWDLVPLPMSQSVIGTKWVFRNKLDENGIVSRNKARLVAQGYNQQEGIDYDETYAPVARLESIRILLAIACANDFKLYQMDVKSAFLNGFINEEVYVAQPPGFIDFQKPNYVYKLKKALYGLKQAPKACLDDTAVNPGNTVRSQLIGKDLVSELLVFELPLSSMEVFVGEVEGGQSVFTSRASRRLFDIRGPLVNELILEFFSTFRFGEVVLDLDTVGALQFQLGGAWVSAGPARQEGDAGGVAEEALVAPEGGDEDDEMPQAVPSPPRTQDERIARLEEEVHGMRKVLQGQREVLNSMACDLSRTSLKKKSTMLVKYQQSGNLEVLES
ncbi:retrovirus-related pol polyprotein from transposon TNT 1-94 [Tanacetum coccineum]